MLQRLSPLSKVPGSLLKGGQDSGKHWIPQTQRVGEDFLSRASLAGGSLDWCPFSELGRTYTLGENFIQNTDSYALRGPLLCNL